MKVRLKHNDLGVLKSAGEFQFHEGPIKTMDFSMSFDPVSAFQFHEGPIKTINALQFSSRVFQVSIP